MIKRPKLMRDWIGLTVTNRKEIETQGGVVFPPGTQFDVVGVYHGLKLGTVRECPAACPECTVQHRHGVGRIRPEELDILEGR